MLLGFKYHFTPSKGHLEALNGLNGRTDPPWAAAKPATTLGMDGGSPCSQSTSRYNLLLFPQLNKFHIHCSGPLFSNRCWWLGLPHHFHCPNFFFLLPPELGVCVSLPGAQRASLGLIPPGSISVSSEILAARGFGLCLLAPNPAKQFGLCCVLLGCSLQLPGQVSSSCPPRAEERFVCWDVLPCCLAGCGFGNHIQWEVSWENESMGLAFLSGVLKLGCPRTCGQILHTYTGNMTRQLVLGDSNLCGAFQSREVCAQGKYFLLSNVFSLCLLGLF